MANPIISTGPKPSLSAARLSLNLGLPAAAVSHFLNAEGVKGVQGRGYPVTPLLVHKLRLFRIKRNGSLSPGHRGVLVNIIAEADAIANRPGPATRLVGDPVPPGPRVQTKATRAASTATTAFDSTSSAATHPASNLKVGSTLPAPNRKMVLSLRPTTYLENETINKKVRRMSRDKAFALPGRCLVSYRSQGNFTICLLVFVTKSDEDILSVGVAKRNCSTDAVDIDRAQTIALGRAVENSANV